MFVVETLPWGWKQDGHQRSDVAETVASGNTAEDCLRNLVEALNEDEIDTENNKLEVSEAIY